MHLLTSLERRFAVTIQDETLLHRAIVSFIPAIFTTVNTLIWGILFFANELPTLGWIYFAYVVVASLTILAGTYRPRLAALNMGAHAMAGIVTNTAAHLAAGGFDSGVWFLVWLVIIPLALYLSGFPRQGLQAYALALVALVVAFVADPHLGPPPPIPDWLRYVYNALALFTSVTMTLLWSVYILQQLDAARRRADALLLNILPAPITDRLKHDTSVIADGFDEVTVLFADIVNFTSLSADTDPVEVVAFLNAIFSEFDELAQKHGLEKIKTIGDAYMVAGGLNEEVDDYSAAIADMAIAMRDLLRRDFSVNASHLEVRIGIGTGPIVAGVLGKKKFIYDLWGDTVNIASRITSEGVPGMIQCDTTTYHRLSPQFEFHEPQTIYLKGKGNMTVYRLVGRKEAPAGAGVAEGA